jgi:translation elongation factor EF-Tu-like GTPase
MAKRPVDAEAKLTFLPPEDGGRKTPARSEYRPQFYYDGHDWDAVHTYPDTDEVQPGDTVRVFLAFLSPEAHVGKLRPGKAFLIREGRRIIGYGSITRIVDLDDSARNAAHTR